MEEAGCISKEVATRCLRSECSNGAVKRVWSNGVGFVGDANAEVTWTTDPASGLVNSASVTVASPSSAAQEAQMAAEYAAAGRSTAGDLATLVGTTNAVRHSEHHAVRQPGNVGIHHGTMRPAYNYGTPNIVFASGCVNINNAAMYSHGCYTRKGTASTDCCHYYLADSGQFAAHANYGGYWLNGAGQNTSYNNGALVVNWTPGADITTGSCYTATIGANFYGASFSISYPFCPNKIHVSVSSSSFGTAWQGCKGAQTTIGAAQANWARANGGTTNMVYTISGSWQYSGC